MTPERVARLDELRSRIAAVVDDFEDLFNPVVDQATYGTYSEDWDSEDDFEHGQIVGWALTVEFWSAMAPGNASSSSMSVAPRMQPPLYTKGLFAEAAERY
ncbi:MAG: hypothetical protein KDB16_12130 [Acidimicrobiales bacterium]|nr:hypothetical protein [Acidimicrobiales bacterium]